MKTIFLITFIILSFASNTFSQSPCPPAMNIQSPVVQKPIQAAIVSVTCSVLVIKWQGGSEQTYRVIAIEKDATGNKTEKTINQQSITHNGLEHNVGIPVKAGSKISWSIQAIKLIKNKTFYSYPLRGKESEIPNCNNEIVKGINNSNIKTIVEKTQPAIFPNPVQSILNITLSSFTKSAISIFDVHGKKVIDQQTAQNNLQIHVQQLASGIYFIRIADTKGKIIYNSKFIKQ